MLTLKEIANAAGSDAQALIDAKAYTATVAKNYADRLIDERIAYTLLGPDSGEALIDGLEKSALLKTRAKKWVAPDFGGLDIADSEVLAAIAALVSAGDITQEEADIVTSYGSDVTTPYVSSTLHDVKILRNTLDYKTVTNVNGYATITVTEECENHHPQLMAFNTRTEAWQRVNNFRDVSATGIYDCKVPPEWSGASLKVDDAYGVI